MRTASLVLAALALGVVELVWGWRLSVLGATADLLFALVAFAATRLPQGGAVPAACCIGLWSDFLVGGRLGIMALGYGLGVRVLLELVPLAEQAGRGSRGAPGRRSLVILATSFAGAAVAHAVPAAASAFSGAESPGRALTRAALVALFTALVSPLLWPVFGIGERLAARTGLE